MLDQVDRQELYASPAETDIREALARHFRDCPIPDADILNNLGLFLNSKNLSRILCMDHLYQQVVDVMGVVVEFGTRWGQNASLFAALRGIYEPFNRHRKIIAFDTFTGFPSLHEKDNLDCDVIRSGGLATTDGYHKYLERIMQFQEADSPLSHICKFEIRRGDATIEIDRYLDEHPETIVALAYFDFDIYEPTKKCLEAIRSRLVKGSVLAFDELNDPDSPGETAALMEVFGLHNIRLKRYRYASRVSYFVAE
jgi:hypothetical protein